MAGAVAELLSALVTLDDLAHIVLQLVEKLVVMQRWIHRLRKKRTGR